MFCLFSFITQGYNIQKLIALKLKQKTKITNNNKNYYYYN